MASADDFARLVSRANPAARGQYLAPGSPPSGAAQYDLDPFFEDADDDGPSPSYPASMRTNTAEGGLMMDSVPNLPLASNAAPPAGRTPNQSSSGLPQGWDFQDDAVALPPPSVMPPESSTTSGRKRKWKWKWPWGKEVQLEGEREIWLNDNGRNEFVSNYVSTSKYNAATFLPKFLAGMLENQKLTQTRGQRLTFVLQNNSPNTPICFFCSRVLVSLYVGSSDGCKLC